MEEKASTARVALKWGLILGIAQILFSTVLFLTDQMANQALASLTYVLIIGALIMAMREFRTQNDGFMSYGQGLGLGALTSGISGLISSIYSVFYMTFIDSGIMERMADVTRAKLEEQGIADEQIDQQIEMIQKFQTPGFLFIFGLIGTIFMGFIFSLVIAAVLKKNKPVFD